MEKLRVEGESHLARAEKAEQEVKELKAELAKKETETQSLNNKITLLQQDLDRTERRIDEVCLLICIDMCRHAFVMNKGVRVYAIHAYDSIR